MHSSRGEYRLAIFLIQVALSSTLRSRPGVIVPQPALPKRLSGEHTIDYKKIAIGPELPKVPALG
jgi:hypothetical protein